MAVRAARRVLSGATVPPTPTVLPVFPGTPESTPVEDLPPPRMELSRLAGNDLRVASQETYGQLCNFGVFVDAGSRVETEQNQGTTQLMELMGFKSTQSHSHEAMHVAMAEIGGTSACFATRDLIMYNVEVLREHLEPAMELLAETLLRPRITLDEVEEMKMVMELQLDQLAPDVLLKEAMHEAAFGRGTALGKPHYCPREAIPRLSVDMLHEYRSSFYNAPRMVVVGAGVDHQHFVELSEKHLGGIPAGSSETVSVMSPYQGGEARRQATLSVKAEFTHVGLTWMSPWANVDDRVPLCVMQVLLGGGNSFSAGGPGKGMYSRLYREVLNRHREVEAAEAQIEPSGLVGIFGACFPEYSTELVYAFAQQFAKLCFNEITEEELSRARNMLKCNVLTFLESHHTVFDDIGQQLLLDDNYMTPAEVCARIDRVTAADIRRVANTALESGPSIASIGEDLSRVPDRDTVLNWFRPPK